MSYSVIFAGTSLFLISVGVHIAVWRWLRPAKEFTALVSVFIVLPAVLTVLAPLAGFVRFDALELAGVFLLGFALSAAYISSYPALQASSPSLVMLLYLKRTGGAGMSLDELAAVFSAEGLVKDRVNDLLRAGLVTLDGGRCFITAKGRLLLGPFAALRRVLGLSAGRG